MHIISNHVDVTSLKIPRDCLKWGFRKDQLLPATGHVAQNLDTEIETAGELPSPPASPGMSRESVSEQNVVPGSELVFKTLHVVLLWRAACLEAGGVASELIFY